MTITISSIIPTAVRQDQQLRNANLAYRMEQISAEDFNSTIDFVMGRPWAKLPEPKPWRRRIAAIKDRWHGEDGA